MKNELKTAINTLSNYCKGHKCSNCSFSFDTTATALQECPVSGIRLLSEMTIYSQILKRLDEVETQAIRNAKVFAIQVPPKEQKSTLLRQIDEGELNSISFVPKYKTANTYMPIYIDEVFDIVNENLSDIISLFFESGIDRSGVVRDILNEYGINRLDGKQWSKYQIGEWKKLALTYKEDEESAELYALKLITGNVWKKVELEDKRNVCDCYYDTTKFSKEDLERVKVEYFNKGTEWKIRYDANMLENPSVALHLLPGKNHYCISPDTESIREEIAKFEGVKPQEVVLLSWEFTKEIYQISTLEVQE